VPGRSRAARLDSAIERGAYRSLAAFPSGNYEPAVLTGGLRLSPFVLRGYELAH
jgi:hypothetical protein